MYNDKFTITSHDSHSPYPIESVRNMNDTLIMPSIGVDYTYKLTTHNALGVKLGYPSIGLAYKLIF